jgi:small subunit ribosomal protein S20
VLSGLQFDGERDTIAFVNPRREVNNLPNIKSAIKRVKVTEKKNLRNRMIKSAMKTQIKKFETAVSANEADVKLLSATQGAVDKAAAKGVIHKNAANRKKARLAKRLAKAEA